MRDLLEMFAELGQEKRRPIKRVRVGKLSLLETHRIKMHEDQAYEIFQSIERLREEITERAQREYEVRAKPLEVRLQQMHNESWNRIYNVCGVPEEDREKSYSVMPDSGIVYREYKEHDEDYDLVEDESCEMFKETRPDLATDCDICPRNEECVDPKKVH